jgi:mono/diheme cytochrome c family protein
MLHCMGCHTSDGSGEPGRVPSVRETLLPRASTEAGRKYLVQVPGSAQSRLSNADLAEVLNWMIRNLTPESQRQPFKPYTAEEVARLRPRYHSAR